jgi:hypothetical protein
MKSEVPLRSSVSGACQPGAPAVMSVFNRQERKTPSGIFGVRLISLMQACAVEGGH